MGFQGGGKSRGLEQLLQHTDLGYSVPEYDQIDVSYYDAVEKQEQMALMASFLSASKKPDKRVMPYVASKLPTVIEERVSELANKYKGKNVIVRSDSFREDGKHSFAGIYKSVEVERASKKKLIDAVTQVYASLYSDKAKRYRQEHNIPDDKMGIIIQKFIEPNWAGVMYTSNPSFPSDLSVEFCPGRNTVVKGEGPTWIKEFEKRTKDSVFESENFRYVEEEQEKIVDKLAEIGINLEKLIGPSYIEFLVKDKKIFLVQRREVTDLEEPVDVEIPKYDKEQYIGFTNVMRGKGKFTLPVVCITDTSALGQMVSILSLADPRKAEEEIRKYFDKIMQLDEKYKDGYVLLTPHFDATVIKEWGVFASSKVPHKPTMDILTPHKKAVITTTHGLVSSHIMTVARERGIAYAGFERGEEVFKDVFTGDVLSVYFKKRKAFVYKEKTPLKSMKETHPKASIKIKKRKKGYVSFETPNYDYLGSHKSIVNDFEYFLNHNTNYEWKRITIAHDMGAVFTNSKEKSIYLSIAAQHGSYYDWSLLHDSCIIGFKKPLPKQEFDDILKRYVKYVKK
ncbi:hypothetical protein AYK26_04570 [Euryarchaeota archaeon SM23-78]|nr:MAG: hypothetical protein AYK26_04570 [Euryarchaeota archaeon SM23-78]MBW3000712.1 PEP/pyruvate-binding domain-containing protein [Candidatus Woesearchaeota archaeon]